MYVLDMSSKLRLRVKKKNEALPRRHARNIFISEKSYIIIIGNKSAPFRAIFFLREIEIGLVHSHNWRDAFCAVCFEEIIAMLAAHRLTCKLRGRTRATAVFTRVRNERKVRASADASTDGKLITVAAHIRHDTDRQPLFVSN